MEINPIEMMAFCIALLDHIGSLTAPLAGLDDGATTAAMSDLTEGIGVLAGDAAAAGTALDEMRPMVAGMPAEDLQEGAAFCLEMAEGI